MISQEDEDKRPCTDCHKLYGRCGELRTLKKIYEISKNPDATGAQIVFVGGESGIGKSSTVFCAFHDSDSLYGAGKYDQLAESRPFTAIIYAFGEICNGMALQKQEYSPILHEGLREDELVTLTKFIPELKNVVETTRYESSRIEKSGPASVQFVNSTQQDLERLRYCLRQFLRLISRKERPVVLFIDDFQWAGPGSLSILQFLLADQELKHCVFVGAYRNNELDPDHPVAQFIEKFENDLFSVTHILLGSLNVDTLSTFLSDCLQTEKTHELAELIHARTHGNMFHVLQLVDFLKAKKLLNYNRMEFKWTWDIVAVRNETVVSKNVLDILRIRFEALPDDVQTFLKLSACLGFRFDMKLLEMVTHVIHPPLSNLTAPFEAIVRENIIELLSEGRYKFCHDSIYQAALNLVDEQTRNNIHLKIGTAIYQSYGRIENMDARTAFLVTNQINQGTSFLEQGQRLDVAILNLEAGKQAAKLGAFASAVDYFEMGLSLLDLESCWSEHYDLSLQLHTYYVQMCLNASKYESIQENIDRTLKNTRCVEDSLPLHFVSAMLKLRLEADYNGHIQMCLDLMKTLGWRSPPVLLGMHRRRMIKRTETKLMSMSDEEILSLPELKDARTEALIRIAFEMHASMFHLGRRKLHSIIICQAVETTLNLGLCPYGSLCIAIFGNVIINELDDVDNACRCGRIAMSMANKLNVKSIYSPLVFQISLYGHWREPFPKLVDALFDGYTQGIRCGENFHAFQNLTAYVYSYYFAGLKLGPLVHDIAKFVNLYLLYGGSQVLQWAPFYQYILNMTGDSDNILDLSRGKAIDIRNKIQQDGYSELSSEKASQWTCKLKLYFYCEVFDKATIAYEALKGVDLGLLRCASVCHGRFFSFALVCIQNAKCSGWKLKARREARKYFNLIRYWVKKKQAINLAHRYIILKAEMMTLSRRKVPVDKLTQAYERAIVASSRAGFIHDAGLAAQLASRAVDGQKSVDFFNQALELYTKWGAHGLVRYLIKSKDSCEVNCSLTSSGKRGLRSRERYDSHIFDDQRVSTLMDHKETTRPRTSDVQ